MKTIEDEMTITTAPIGRGAAWLIESLPVFTSAWKSWLGMGLVFFLICVVLTIIPLGTFVLNLFFPAFLAGLFLACRAQEAGEPIEVKYLFAGFSENLGSQIILGVIILLSQVIVLIIAAFVIIVFMGGTGILMDLIGGNVEAIQEDPQTLILVISLGLLVGVMFYLPLLMAFWFAPLLVELENQSVFEAMKNSFMACLKNIMPYLLYGLVGLVFSVLATIPLGLGWLILLPMFVISIYLSYKDIFQKTPAIEVA